MIRHGRNASHQPDSQFQSQTTTHVSERRATHQTKHVTFQAPLRFTFQLPTSPRLRHVVVPYLGLSYRPAIFRITLCETDAYRCQSISADLAQREPCTPRSLRTLWQCTADPAWEKDTVMPEGQLVKTSSGCGPWTQGYFWISRNHLPFIVAASTTRY